MNNKIGELIPKIITIRGKNVILDTELAKLYKVKAFRLRETIKRNRERFPADFMFRLTEKEVDTMVSQNAIPSKMALGGTLPLVFTEQGVAMLSGVLRSKTAIEINIKIMRAFVEMRKFIVKNKNLFEKILDIEKKQIIFEDKTENKLKKIFKIIENDKIPLQGIFYEGQIYDAHKFAIDLIKSAKKSIKLIDNYVNEDTLTLLSNGNVKTKIFTKNISNKLRLSIKKYNEQYNYLEIEKITHFHDRFLIIDDINIYHIGASLKDLGKKTFAFSKLNIEIKIEKLTSTQVSD